jgi:tetratricopeptide (TPR) repeat protein
VLRRKGQSDKAFVLLTECLRLAQQYQQSDQFHEVLAELEWRACNWLCSIALTEDDYSGARRYAEHGLQTCRTLKKQIGEMICLSDLLDVARATGDYPNARLYAEQTLQQAHILNYRWSIGMTQVTLGEIARLEGDYDRAYELSVQGLAITHEIGDLMGEVYATNELAYLALSLGQYARAEILTDDYFRLLRAGGEPAREMFLGLLPLALQAHALGNAEQALGYAERAWQMAQELDGRASQARVLTVLGMIYESMGNLTAAEGAHRQALRFFTELGHTHLAAEPQAGLARIAALQGAHSEAQMHVEALLLALAEHHSIGLSEPFRIYLTCFQILNESHDPRASDILGLGQQRLRTYADHIADKETRRSFLENVATHRTLNEKMV